MISRLAIGAFIVAVVVGLVGRELDRRWHTALVVPPGGYYLTVEQGDTLSGIVSRLQREGVVPYPALVRWYGRWSGLDREIKQGEYLLPQYLTIPSLLALLARGEVIQYQVTLPEGITLERALQLLHAQSRLKRVLESTRDPRVLALIAPHTNPEGLFFPDSYRFQRGSSDWQILQRAFFRMQSVLNEEWLEKADGLPYETRYEALIMASIIERETGLPAERETIAGVFVRRLERNMRLQTDPTVIYGLGDKYDGNIRRSDLHDDTNPYNTYRHHGLPPSPIALPGRAAIHAALHPRPGDALYFVARGDGGHVFSASLRDHQKAVRKYQLQRRSDYRSTPEK